MNSLTHTTNNALSVKAYNYTLKDCSALLQKMGDCFIRVSENSYTSSYTYNCFDVLNGDVAVYLSKEIITITNYIHAVSGDTSGSSNL